MRLYKRTFVNPLLAYAFKDGVEFAELPFFKVRHPKKEGDKYVVLIEDYEEDDDDNLITSECTQTSDDMDNEAYAEWCRLQNERGPDVVEVEAEVVDEADVASDKPDMTPVEPRVAVLDENAVMSAGMRDGI